MITDLLVSISNVPLASHHARRVLLQWIHASLVSLDSSWALNVSHNAPLATPLIARNVLDAIPDVKSALHLRPLDACNVRVH